MGQVVLSKTVVSMTDFFEQELELQDFAVGVYLLKVQAGGVKWVEKVIKD